MNVTRWPTLIVTSSGIIPFEVIEIVGVEGAGDGVLTGGVGEDGVDASGGDAAPPEQAADITIEMSTRARISVRPGRDRRSYLIR
jgi:hypothetical protein